MVTPVNIMIGRFQPFTKGHYECAIKASNYFKEYKNLKTIVCMVNNGTIDDKHPFKPEEMVSIYGDFFKGGSKSLIEKVVYVKGASLIDAASNIGDAYNIVSWTCGSDRSEYASQAEKINNNRPDNIDPKFELIIIDRDMESSSTDTKSMSATKVREMLLNDNESDFVRDALPDVISDDKKKKIFDKLRAKILESHEDIETVAALKKESQPLLRKFTAIKTIIKDKGSDFSEISSIVNETIGSKSTDDCHKRDLEKAIKSAKVSEVNNIIKNINDNLDEIKKKANAIKDTSSSINSKEIANKIIISINKKNDSYDRYSLKLETLTRIEEKISLFENIICEKRNRELLERRVAKLERLLLKQG